MSINSIRNSAVKIFQYLDSKDNKKNCISAKVWNEFAQGKGNNINVYINRENAIKSIEKYIKNTANKTGESFQDIVTKWMQDIEGKTATPYGTQEVQNSLPSLRRAPITQPALPSIESLEDTTSIENGVYPRATFKSGYKPLLPFNNSFAFMERSEALVAAEIEARKPDGKLEKLVNRSTPSGNRVTIKEKAFINDIPYGRTGQMDILAYVAQNQNVNITITSALGTAGKNGRQSGTHTYTSQYTSHYNADNPKLDIISSSCGMRSLAYKLQNTGLFNWVLNEHSHLDIQIKPEVYVAYDNYIDALQRGENVSLESFLDRFSQA